MDTFLGHAIATLSTNLEGIKAILLRGSKQTDDQVDFWSDTDLLVVFHPGVGVEEKRFVQAIDQIGFVIASELYSGQESVLYRAAIEFESSVQLLDATVCSHDEWVSTEAFKEQSSTIVYGQIETIERTKANAVDYSFDSYKNQINRTWFKYLVAIKKFARDDHLIGMHLLLDLIREYLVLEMIERDIRCGTNIHRFGSGEQLPATMKLSCIDESDRRSIFDYIAKLAYEYDRKLGANIPTYKSRYDQVCAYLERSKRHLLGDH